MPWTASRMTAMCFFQQTFPPLVLWNTCKYCSLGELNGVKSLTLKGLSFTGASTGQSVLNIITAAYSLNHIVIQLLLNFKHPLKYNHKIHQVYVINKHSAVQRASCMLLDYENFSFLLPMMPHKFLIQLLIFWHSWLSRALQNSIGVHDCPHTINLRFFKTGSE